MMRNAPLQHTGERHSLWRRFVCFSAIVAIIFGPGSTRANGENALAPGYLEPLYPVPIAGSYELPPVGNAADGEVLDSNGNSLRLHELYGDKIVLLSFMYGNCSDLNGCPLAKAVFFRIRSALDEQPQLADKLRLVSLSFDPVRDTPKAMKHYGADLADGAVEWRFLTTRSHMELKPILSNYNQAVRHEHVPGHNQESQISHILRVFLIDHAKRVRNIYSVSFLQEEILVNDVKTLLLEQESMQTQPSANTQRLTSVSLQGPGDSKRGYETTTYQTRSRELKGRKGSPANLLNIAQSAPLGLPPVPVPDNNPLSKEKIALGRKLFYDRRLSLNNTMSCAMCHIPEQGFTSNEMKTAVGIEGRTVRRNAPTIYNVAYVKHLFHDGRETTLEQQVWSPILAKNEMSAPAIGWLIERIRRIPDYSDLFEQAFGKRPTMESIGKAIASYERTLLSADSPFDRWYFGKEDDAIGPLAKNGFEVFRGKGGCSACHLINKKYALFTDNSLHNTGVGYKASMLSPGKTQKVIVAPGKTLEIEQSIIDSVSEKKQNDLGLYELTLNPADRWKYKTPSLRNVALTAPYMHDGSISTLHDVIEYYNKGGVPNELLDPRIRPLNLNAKEKKQLLAFLQSLTGSNIDVLVADAFAAPIGDPE